MRNCLRGELLAFIEEHDKNGEGNWIDDIKGGVTSDNYYYPNILKAFREVCDNSYGKNEDGSLYFLPFRIDTIGDDDRYTAAFVGITIGDKYYSVMFDSCVKDDFYSVEEFVDTIVELAKQAEDIKNTFSSLRPIYND